MQSFGNNYVASTFASVPNVVALDVRSNEMGYESTIGFRYRKYVGWSGGEDADSNVSSSLAVGFQIVKDVELYNEFGT